MLVNRVILELGITGGTHRIPGFLEAAATRGHTGGGIIGAVHEITRILDGRRYHVLPHQRIAAPGCNGIHLERGDGVQRIAPIAEMPVAAIAGRVVFHDITREHHVLIRHMDHDIARRVRAAQMHQVDPAVAQIDGHVIAEGRGGPSQAGDALMPLEQARETLELAVPILLTTLHHHGAGLVAHDDLTGPKGGCAQHAHGVVMGQHHMADRLVGDRAHAVDHLVRQTRGRLRLDDHHGLVADDDAGIGVPLGGEGIHTLAHFGEGDLLFGHVALRCKSLGHGSSFLRSVPGQGWDASGGDSLGKKKRKAYLA